MGTIDGPLVPLDSVSGHLIYQTRKVVAAHHTELIQPLLENIILEDPPAPHPFFILFDFKQNLRRWPNVSRDISRSPPYLFL